MRRSGLILGLAGAGILAALNGAAATPGQHPKALKAEARFPNMDAALGYLKAANQQLQDAKPVFHGHREKAQAHVRDAIADLQQGISQYMVAHPEAVRNEITPEAPPSEAGERDAHMSGALKLLQEAETRLTEATRQYNGKRVEGLEQTKAAIAEIKEGLAQAPAPARKGKR